MATRARLRHTGSRPVVAAVGGALLVSLSLAACSSGEGSDKESSDVPAEVSSSVEEALQPPTDVGTTEELPEAPPSGKTVVAMACEGLPPCELYLSQFEEAAAALGWEAVTVSFAPTPEDILDKFQYALDQAPDGIVINGVPRATFENALDGVDIPIIQQDIDDKPSAPVVAVQNGTAAFEDFGKLIGDWAVHDSEGSADALLFTYSTFPIGQTLINAAADEITSTCSECSAEVVIVQPEDTGTALPGKIVSELQRNPDADYVLLQDGGMALGLIPALKAAGLEDRVTIAGGIPDSQALQDIETGVQAAYVNLPLGQQAWQGLDGLARALMGLPQPEWSIPAQILVKDGDYSAEDGHVEPPDYQNMFKELWKVN